MCVMNAIEMRLAQYHVDRAKANHAKAQRLVKKAEKHQDMAMLYVDKVKNRIMASYGTE
jgi:septation ring formation regulator EzrA